MSFFDFNNQDHRQMAEAYNNNTYSQLPSNQVMSAYQSFLQSAPEDQINQVHQDYFSQMPQNERQGLFSGLLGLLQQQQPGFDPRQAGLSTTDPNRASAMDLTNLFGMARNSGLLGGLLGGNRQQQQQQPGYYDQQNPGMSRGLQGLQSLMSNPLAQAALSGLISFAANQAFSGMMNRGQQQQPQQPMYGQQNSGYNQQPNYNQPPNGQSFGGRDQYQSGLGAPSRDYNQSSNYGGSNQDVEDLGGGGSALPGFGDNQRSY